MNPKIYILLATVNRALLLEETLISIIGQTYGNWECIIVDDYSTDNTAFIVEQYRKKDPRFSYFLKSSDYSRGLSGSRNQGLDIAKKKEAQYIQFFDDDDLMHPEKLEIQVKELVRNPHYDFSLCASLNFWKIQEIQYNEEQKDFFSSRFSLGEAYLIDEIRFVAQVPLFRNDYIQKVRFDEELFYAEEWALFSMLFLYSSPEFSVTEKVLVYRRKHEGAVTVREEADVLRRQTTIVAEIKVFEFLKVHDKHTNVTLAYFGKKFLLYRYDSGFVDEIKLLLQTKSRIDYNKFKIAILIHWLLRRIILRILR